MKYLLLGPKGQLGSYFQRHLSAEKDVSVVSVERSQWAIGESLEVLKKIFEQVQPDFVVNCAAYTQVDLAEKDFDRAFEVNGYGLFPLVKFLNSQKTPLVHVSTDYVFDGLGDKPYLESDPTLPQSIYGLSKLMGEKILSAYCDQYTVFRTSWLYSPDFPSFYSKILSLGQTRPELSIVSDQLGSPTFAGDLAAGIHAYCSRGFQSGARETFHFSNLGQTSWYEFTKEIFKMNGLKTQIKPIPSSQFPTPAKRPSYSVLSNEKWKTLGLGFSIPWQESLLKARQEIQ